MKLPFDMGVVSVGLCADCGKSRRLRPAAGGWVCEPCWNQEATE